MFGRSLGLLISVLTLVHCSYHDAFISRPCRSQSLLFPRSTRSTFCGSSTLSSRTAVASSSASSLSAFAFPIQAQEWVVVSSTSTNNDYNPWIQIASCIITYVGLIGYVDRPRGRLEVDESSIQIKPSTVEGAAYGLFATQFMPEGTRLGTYPGVLRPAKEYMEKYNHCPKAGVYAWRLGDNQYFIDPTDASGMLGDFCGGGSTLFLSYFLHEYVFRFQVPTYLSRINEPPIGGNGCNVRSEENPKAQEVVFVLSRDVYPGEEFFMDYGLSYDRSGYGKR